MSKKAEDLSIQPMNTNMIVSLETLVKNPELVQENTDALVGVIYNNDLAFYVASKEYFQKFSNKTFVRPVQDQSVLFDEVATEWILNKANTWSETHVAEKKRRLEKNIMPYFGKMKISSITSKIALDFIRIQEQRSRFDITHRIANDLSQIFKYAIARGDVDFDPIDPIKGALIPHRVKNFKTIPIKQISTLLYSIKDFQHKHGKTIELMLKLLVLTFVRSKELLGAKWNEIDMENKVWNIPSERMKMKLPHVVPLSEETLILLEEIRAYSKSKDYLFTDPVYQGPVKPNRLISAIYNMGFKSKMTAHGFRALASTVLNEKGFPSDVIERQLAHVDSNSVRRAYNRAEYMEERRNMMNWWSSFIMENCPTFIKSNQSALNL